MKYEELAEEANNAAVLPKRYETEWYVSFVGVLPKTGKTTGCIEVVGDRFASSDVCDVEDMLKEEGYTSVILTNWMRLDPSEEQERCL